MIKTRQKPRREHLHSSVSHIATFGGIGKMNRNRGIDDTAGLAIGSTRSRLTQAVRKRESDQSPQNKLYYSFKTSSCAHIASAFNVEIEIKNIILVALRTVKFSHSLDPIRTWTLLMRSWKCGVA